MSPLPVSVTSEPVIRLEKVQRSYQLGGEEVQALAGIDFSFAPGSFWAIMGPSGSGKSTLLNLIGCLDRPSAGHYYLLGQDIGLLNDDELSELRLRRLGFVFQSFNLIPQLSVRENIELPLYYLNEDEARSRQRARELAEMVGLGSRLQHRPMELSGGQQQRVAVARALANDPAILLADEPTGNLDSGTSRQIMELLRGLNDQGRTIIMVTHEEDIASYAHGRLLMRDGRIEAVVGS
jgi:putative ABC transport system ATP-binding protein